MTGIKVTSGRPFVLGAVPKGLTLKGIIEPKAIVTRYINWFSEKVSMTSEEWISFHKTNALDLIANFKKGEGMIE